MLQCPQCHATIGEQDFNVSTDLAYCRQCSKSHKYSELVAISEIKARSEDEAPSHVRIYDNVDSVDLVYRRISPALIFFLPFTAVWSGGSMWGIYGTQIIKGKFDLGQSLFGIPFLIGTVVLVSVVLFMLLGKWRIRLAGEESEVFAGVGGIGWRRPFNFSRVNSVILKMTSVSKGNVPQRGICLKFDEGDDLTFGTILPDNVKEYIAGFLTGRLRKVR